MRPCAPGHFPVDSLLNGLGKDVKIVLFRRNQRIFSRGDPSRLLFYIQHGSVKLTLTSLQGKEAVIAVLDGGSFLGHSALEFDQWLGVNKNAKLRGASNIPYSSPAELAQVLTERRLDFGPKGTLF